MNYKFKGLILIATASVAFTSNAKEIKITTWNTEHLMSEARFLEWKKFCEPLGWPDSRDKSLTDEIKAKLNSKPSYLTYCNALNGLHWGKVQSKPVHDIAAHKAKVQALEEASSKLQSDIYFFQEVSDAIAIKELLNNPSYEVISSFELLKNISLPQNVGVAYKKELFDARPQITLNKTLMVEHNDRKVRPGIELQGVIGGKPVVFLNVHMKASCRWNPLDDKKADCETYARQVPKLETWVEAQTKAGNYFILLGDFNRHFVRDMTFEARSDGGSASNIPSGTSKTRSMLKEINDSVPNGTNLYYTANHFDPPYKSWDCHKDIDRFMINESWARLLSVSYIFETTDLGLGSYGYNYPGHDKNKVQPSDHCPITLKVAL
ncbi:hypothetical protein [Photobacterium sp. GSS17]|uniref:hypothetical protein n=1 Tax=Photobacterium sp. GSS17 TaxID=3020715 RepID=UPI002360F3F5|nr:hypothetical protein [Photobacterium sp. GSS17]